MFRPRADREGVESRTTVNTGHVSVTEGFCHTPLQMNSMPSNAYHLGLLLVVFGGFLLLGRTLFAGSSELFGELSLVIMVVGAIVGVLGLTGSPTSEKEEG